MHGLGQIWLEAGQLELISTDPEFGRMWPDFGRIWATRVGGMITTLHRFWSNVANPGAPTHARQHARGTSVYEGEYENDKKHGVGKFTWPSGRSYEGQWVSGRRQGVGWVCPGGRQCWYTLGYCASTVPGLAQRAPIAPLSGDPWGVGKFISRPGGGIGQNLALRGSLQVVIGGPPWSRWGRLVRLSPGRPRLARRLRAVVEAVGLSAPLLQRSARITDREPSSMRCRGRGGTLRRGRPARIAMFSRRSSSPRTTGRT